MLSTTSRPKRSCTNYETGGKISVANKKIRQGQAFTQLLELRQENTGNTLNHDIARIVVSFNDPCVTRSNMYYMLHKKNDSVAVVAQKPSTVVTSEVGTTNSAAVVAAPEPTTPVVSVDSYGDDDDSIISDVSNISAPKQKNLSMDGLGMDILGIAYAMLHVPSNLTQKQVMLHCITIAAERYTKARKDALKKDILRYSNTRKDAVKEDILVETNSLKNIIKKVEQEYNLTPGSLCPKTVSRRVYSKSETSLRSFETNPLYAIEPTAINTVLEVTQMGLFVDKKSLIAGVTSHVQQNNDYLQTVNPDPLPRLLDANMIEQWYFSFRRRHAKIWKSTSTGSSTDVNSTADDIVTPTTHKAVVVTDAPSNDPNGIAAVPLVDPEEISDDMLLHRIFMEQIYRKYGSFAMDQAYQMYGSDEDRENTKLYRKKYDLQ
jgi:hypothetical protein